MIDVLRWAHERSVYADLEFDAREANRVLVNVVQRHGGKGEAGTFVAVCGSPINGLIVGVLQRVYHIGALCSATDLFWVGTNKASARNKVALMLGLTEWAKAHPKAVDVVSAASGVTGDEEKAARILEHIGFARFGGLWRMPCRA